MSISFITKAPSEDDIKKLMLYMSTFTDGSGYERNPDGSTRPGWRDFERIIAEFLSGRAPEGKSIFDVTVSSTEIQNSTYGISVKSKSFSKTKFKKLQTTGRVYMELCNSPAKLWAPLQEQNITEAHFHNQECAQEIGDSILNTVHSWYLNSGITNIDLDNSVHLTISYGQRPDNETYYQVDTFDLDFPTGIKWEFSSKRCLRGYDPEHPKEAIFDWYGLSGGQLKYYPRASKALFSSGQFSLLKAKHKTIAQKAKEYWPEFLP